MNSFNIKYNYSNKNSLEENILKYPRETGPFTITSTTAYITIKIDGKLVKGAHWGSEKLKSIATTSVWLWDFCILLTYETIRIGDGKIHKVHPIDDPTILTFVKENDLVTVTASAGYVPLQTKVSYSKFMQEILWLVDSFVSDLVSINPRISGNDQFKQIIEGRNKIKKMLEEASA